MKKVLTTAAALAVGATGAWAGGIERTNQSVGIIFEEGTTVEFKYAYVKPDVSGDQVSDLGPFTGRFNSGDMAEDYSSSSLSFNTALNEKIDVALILDQPYGANVNYAAGTGYVYAGSTATLTSTAVTTVLRYKLDESFSVYGGLKAQKTEGEVALFNGYTLSTSAETDYGYLVGAAFEKPEIAMRVALTYQSAIDHNLVATESTSGTTDTFTTTMPQSLMLEAQSGIAANTLLFGSIRWVDWTAFDISPPSFLTTPGVNPTGGALVDYENDTITYNIGIGRKFNETWSGAITVGFEPSTGGFTGNLGPTDGSKSIGIGATYTSGNVKFTGGASYIWIGDAETENALASGTALSSFTDNSGLAVGFKVAYSL
jgi:long-chain fatty acid transport protein